MNTFNGLSATQTLQLLVESNYFHAEGRIKRYFSEAGGIFVRIGAYFIKDLPISLGGFPNGHISMKWGRLSVEKSTGLVSLWHSCSSDGGPYGAAWREIYA